MSLFLMVFWHVLWPWAGCLQRTRSGIRPGACFFPVYFVADCGKVHVITVTIRKKRNEGKSLPWTVVFNNVLENQSLKHLLLSLSSNQQWYFWWLCFVNHRWTLRRGSAVRRCFIFCGNHLRGSVMWPTFTVYSPPISCFPPDWNNLKLFHCWIPLAVTQDSCHAVGYVNCMYNSPSRNTVRVPVLDPTSDGGVSEQPPLARDFGSKLSGFTSCGPPLSFWMLVLSFVFLFPPYVTFFQP